MVAMTRPELPNEYISLSTYALKSHAISPLKFCSVRSLPFQLSRLSKYQGRASSRKTASSNPPGHNNILKNSAT
ncbi:hypothetical protein EAF00_001614 [Botryotinia globosa]|nr:hypothetical protein EAF00_001614 [Botryotinia globosa]